MQFSVDIPVFSPDYFDGPLDDKTNELVSKIIEADSTEMVADTWEELQGHVWESIPFVKIGDFSKLNVISKHVEGYSRFDGPQLWGVEINR